MKKILLTLLMVLTITLSGCSSDLEDAANKMDSLDSYRMDVTMKNVPMFGTITTTMKVDGDVTYTSSPLSDEGVYTKTVDGKTYQYLPQENGEYILSDRPMDEENVDDSNFLNDIDMEDFEKEDNNKWVLKEDRVYLDESETDYMSEVVLIISSDGYIEEMTFKMNTSGMVIEVECTFSGFNSTNIVIPLQD